MLWNIRFPSRNFLIFYKLLLNTDKFVDDVSLILAIIGPIIRRGLGGGAPGVRPPPPFRAIMIRGGDFFQ